MHNVKNIITRTRFQPAYEAATIKMAGGMEPIESLVEITKSSKHISSISNAQIIAFYH